MPGPVLLFLLLARVWSRLWLRREGSPPSGIMYAPPDKADQRRAPLLAADETGGGGADYQAIEKQQQAPKRGCRDPVFLLLFLVNLGLVAWVAATYGVDAVKSQQHGGAAADEPGQQGKNRNMLVAGVILAVLAGVLSGGWMTFMISYAQDLIRCMLWTVIIANVAAAALGLAAGQPVLALFGLVSAAISFCYLRAVQSYIPFAAAQLRAATSAIKAFFSVVWVAYLALGVACAWCVVWSLATFGVITYFRNQDGSSSSSADTGDDGSPGGGFYFLLLVSFYWTLQVIGGIVNCTVAGVVGTWWYLTKEEQSNVVGGSLGRSVSTSLGSICLGALIVAVLEALKAMVEKSREQKDGVGKCLADCLLSCLDNLARYFNRWAFIYVGIYGYSFTEAGARVLDLFQSRGLTAVINDSLISRVLFLGALMVGLLTCGLGVVLEAVTGNWLAGYGDDAASLLAGLGFVIGFFVCDVMMNVVSSAVAAVLVCFVEDPSALQQTHPDYHAFLIAAWTERFPALHF